MKLTEQEIERAMFILCRVDPTQEEADELVEIADKFKASDPFEGIELDGGYMTAEQDQLLRESDERAAFNDRLDNLRLEM